MIYIIMHMIGLLLSIRLLVCHNVQYTCCV